MEVHEEVFEKEGYEILKCVGEYMQEKSLDKLKNCKICIQHLNNKHARSAK